MWTESAQKKLIADNQDTCFHPLDLGLEGAFSLARYQDRVRAAIVDAPIDALVASVRQYLADNCGVDPFLEEIEWTR
ncbi:hypothetical protein MUG78_17560 [Gordonia alkaliphila]|uniref:hypothetical protein n=1 Tax=Gordonia alkaliphila TaxID=1053547 RepID=UPI001FF24B26|nr:hypothetical protein [Gordonia alkaliphila]MCK0441209.1 hypothetical protein [Gordonia alkaliphila]